MIRRLVAGLIVVGLAVGIWALWPRNDTDPTPTTLPLAVETTTTPAPTTTQAGTTTTGGSHVVTTVAEAEEILRRLWFGWFEGIYTQDEDRIREVVGTQTMLDAAISQFGVMEFLTAPHLESISVTNVEVLESDEECLAVWAETRASFRPGSSAGVEVLRRSNDHWVFAGSWVHRDDLWEADCESVLEPLSS